MTNTPTEARLADIAAEYGAMADGLPPQLEDGPGAASAFYMSCSLGEVASMARELLSRRSLDDGVEPVAWRWKWAEAGDWFCGPSRPARVDLERIHTIEPLYASRPTRNAGVGVLDEKAVIALIFKHLGQVGMSALTHDSGPYEIATLNHGVMEFARAVASLTSPAQETVTDYLVWSNEHRAWWRANSQGYSTLIAGAGLYTRAEAVAIAAGSRDGWHMDRRPDEIAVAIADIPEHIRAALSSKGA
jgi:hypothetical protein